MGIERLLEEETESIGSNTLEYAMDDPLTRTVSYFGNLPTKAILLSGDVGNYPREETQDYIRSYVSNSGLENVTVREGHSRVLKDTLRLFSDKKLKDIPLLSRLFVGVPTTLFGGLIAKLTRADYYNPFTKTAHIYSDIPAVALHELGHAEDYQKRKWKTLYALGRSLPFVALYQEFKASRAADEALKSEDKRQTGRYLVPAFATYLGPVVGLATLPLTIGAHLVGNLYNALFRRKSPKKELEESPA